MPTKKNFLGAQQNYNANTGEYESSLKGTDGKVVTDADGDGKSHEAQKKSFKSFKKSEEKKGYEPKTAVEKSVDKWIEDHWNTMDKDQSLGMLAMRIPVRAPYPVIMDAISKSIAARNELEENTGDLIKEEELPMLSNKERLAEGGLAGTLERKGRKISNVDDKSMIVDDRYKVVDVGQGGFDVYDGDKVIAKNIGNHKDFDALLKKYEEKNPTPMKTEEHNDGSKEQVSDYKMTPENQEEVLKKGRKVWGWQNQIIQQMNDGAYDTPEEVLKAAKRYDLNPVQEQILKNEIAQTFGLDEYTEKSSKLSKRSEAILKELGVTDPDDDLNDDRILSVYNYYRQNQDRDRLAKFRAKDSLTKRKK